MIERMSGIEALLWHMERPGTFMHTLKTVVVDPTPRGAPVTLADLERGISGVLGRAPTDPDFAVADHLEEVGAEAPGDRAALDAVHSRLASTPLDPDRPLWTMTLVHGLEHGRQALVTRNHHAVVDDARVCASMDLPLARMKRIAKSSDTTIDGLFHALIAAALREERAAGVADVVTAIERGPDHRRWSGGLEITDWISFAIVANPCNINITAHSYADQMSVGLLVGHGVLPQPRAFLERMAWELEVLDMALSPWRQSVDERTSG